MSRIGRRAYEFSVAILWSSYKRKTYATAGGLDIFTHAVRTQTQTFTFSCCLYFFLPVHQPKPFDISYRYRKTKTKELCVCVCVWRRSWRLHIVQKCGGPSVIEQCIIFIPSWFIRFNAHRLFNGANKASINRKRIIVAHECYSGSVA